MMRLRKIDDLVLNEHYYLNSTDNCWYITDYFSGKTFSYSEGNKLICDLQLDLSTGETWRREKKSQAIKNIAELVHRLLTPDQLLRATWVPVPPSKPKNHKHYDGRIYDVLKALKVKEPHMDIREIVLQAGEREKAKNLSSKRYASMLYNSYYIDENLLKPNPEFIIIFDDVVTTGATFRAMEMRLRKRFPELSIVGFFIARRVIESTQ